MRIGVARERHADESRVSLGSYAIYELRKEGHRIIVESGAGEASSITDAQYTEAGAIVTDEIGRVYDESELVVKVYGPTPQEYAHLREGLTLLSFLSLQVNSQMTEAIVASRCVAIASEAVRDARGGLPILTPMSEIGGRLVPQIGAHYLQFQSGGRGILLGGSVGVRPGRVVVLGAGIVGSAAARVASGLGAEVTVLDLDLERLRRLERGRLRNVTTLASSSLAIKEAVTNADLLIAAVHIVSSRTPALVDRETVAGMKAGSVIVDVDVDSGGCVATSRPTTLSDPVFVESGVTHYCVRNVPASVPVTSTRALSNALLPYVKKIAGKGLADALNADPGLGRGVAIAEGRVVDAVLARTIGEDYTPISAVIPLHEEVR